MLKWLSNRLPNEILPLEQFNDRTLPQWLIVFISIIAINTIMLQLYHLVCLKLIYIHSSREKMYWLSTMDHDDKQLSLINCCLLCSIYNQLPRSTKNKQIQYQVLRALQSCLGKLKSHLKSINSILPIGILTITLNYYQIFYYLTGSYFIASSTYLIYRNFRNINWNKLQLLRPGNDKCGYRRIILTNELILFISETIFTITFIVSFIYYCERDEYLFKYYRIWMINNF